MPKKSPKPFDILGKMEGTACAEYERCLQKDKQGLI